ncbi:MAG: IS91 family transposase [Anaerolineae bacterium]|jgi:hypothetical protein
MVEIADIFRRYGPQYRAKYGAKILPSHLQAMGAIEHCRTPLLGGHVYTCESCSETQYQYHSCRNRHCPKCQNDKAQKWLEKQQDLLLPVPYFLLTVTLPSELRRVARSRQKQVYDLFFRTSAEAIQQLARDPRFVGGQMGLVGVLHTWGRNLSYHPHIHFLIPGGGLAADGQTWLPSRNSFLLPVKALSRIVRAKFRDALRQTHLFDLVPAPVWRQAWVVHCQPVGSGLPALKYLAPYIFRVAISNNRILALAEGKVTFRYRASDTGKLRTCTLAAEEFIRRFLQHVLPKGFVKVRYYGFLASGCRQRLASIRQQLDNPPAGQAPDPDNGTETESQTEDHPADDPIPNPIVLCPSCGRVMQRQIIPRPHRRRPP